MNIDVNGVDFVTPTPELGTVYPRQYVRQCVSAMEKPPKTLRYIH